MPFTDHFRATDDLIQHIDKTFSELKDPFIESRYTGFLAVSSVTVLELALKTIFIDFSYVEHVVLGNFCERFFEKINGRIEIKSIRETYLQKFGPQYLQKFDAELDVVEQQKLRTDKFSIKSSYGSLLACRNDFSHKGTIPPNTSYSEVKNGYLSGKEIMNCLAKAMQ